MGESPARDRGRAQRATLLAEALAAKLEAGAMFERAEQMQQDNKARRRRLDTRRWHLATRRVPRENPISEQALVGFIGSPRVSPAGESAAFS